MFRFLRRVFIILILFVIVFFIFRLIKPEATSRFVDKVKSIPTTVSSWFHREKKTGIVINGDTTYSSGNFELGGNNNTDSDDLLNSNETNRFENEGENDSDLLRLQEFNREINSIIASGNDDENMTVVVEPEPDVIVEPEPDIVVESEIIVEPKPDIVEKTGSSSNLGEIIGNVLNDGNNTTEQDKPSNQSNNSSTNTSTILTEQQWGDCAEAGLTVQDCEDLVRDFGNYN